MPKPATVPDLSATLAAAAGVIGAFRASLQRAGYPFREPADTRAVLADLDALLYPEELTTRKKVDSQSEAVGSANQVPKYANCPPL